MPIASNFYPSTGKPQGSTAASKPVAAQASKPLPEPGFFDGLAALPWQERQRLREAALAITKPLVYLSPYPCVPYAYATHYALLYSIQAEGLARLWPGLTYQNLRAFFDCLCTAKASEQPAKSIMAGSSNGGTPGH